jgi:hypothetical protein
VPRVRQRICAAERRLEAYWSQQRQPCGLGQRCRLRFTTAKPMLSGRLPAKWPTKVQVNTARSRESMPFLAVSERHQATIGPVRITGATGSDHQRCRRIPTLYSYSPPSPHLPLTRPLAYTDAGACVARSQPYLHVRQRTVLVGVKNRLSRDDRYCSFTAMCGHVRFSLFRIIA